MRRLRVAWSNFWYRIPITRKWGSIIYVHNRYGWTMKQARGMWAKAQKEYIPGRKNFLGWEEDVTSMFFEINAELVYEREEESK